MKNTVTLKKHSNQIAY